MGPIQQTIYGGFWETVVKSEDDADNIDSAYSTVALPAHTDGDLISHISLNTVTSISSPSAKIS